MNTFDLSEIKDTALEAAKKRPFATLTVTVLALGISKGIADGFSKLRPTIETCWKYTVDKVLSKPEQHLSLIDEDQQQDDSIAA